MNQTPDNITFGELIDAILHAPQHTREATLKQWGEGGKAKAIDRLVEALLGTDKARKDDAAATFGESGIGNTETIPYLLEALEDNDAYVRANIALALINIGDASAVPALIESLSDKDHYVRKYSIRALGKIGDHSAVPALSKVVIDGAANYGARDYVEEAIQALRNIEDERAVPALVIALRNDHEDAARTLAKYKTEEVANELFNALPYTQYDLVRSSIRRALVEIGTEGISVLRERLQHREWLSRRMSALVIGELGGRDFAPALIERLDDDDWMVRWAAVEALGKIRGPLAILAIEPLLADAYERVRQEANTAIEYIKVYDRLEPFALEFHNALDENNVYRVETSSAEFLHITRQLLAKKAKGVIVGKDALGYPTDLWRILFLFPAEIIGAIQDRLYAGRWFRGKRRHADLFDLLTPLCALVDIQFNWEHDKEASQLHFQLEEHTWSVQCEDLSSIEEPLRFSRIQPYLFDYLEGRDWTLVPVQSAGTTEFFLLIPNEAVSHINDFIIPSYRPNHPLYDERIIWYFEGLPEDKRPDDPWDLLKELIPK